jgi:lipid-A-disaccharide synthase
LRYFVLAGEASGDKQAALLCKAIYEADEHAVIHGWGGEDMESTGVKITRHYRDLAFMGFVEVIKHLPAIIKNFKRVKAEILNFNPDALILVDYPGFNLKIAGWAHLQNLAVYYYISPQLWAWHTSRVYKIKEAVRRMYVILPFEQAFYKKYGIDALYIGHPLAKENAALLHEQKQVKGNIALLPGSRRHEIEKVLPEMIALASRMPAHSFTIVAVPHLPPELYKEIIGKQDNVKVVTGDMKKTLLESEAAIVTSGTATLETALLNVPQLVVYKGNAFSFWIAKRLVKVPYISLVNLIMDKPVVPELIQEECNPVRMHQELTALLEDQKMQAMKNDYGTLRSLLTSGGGPQSAAKDIIHDAKSFKKHG